MSWYNPEYDDLDLGFESDYEDEDKVETEGGYCAVCNGSGEGMYDGTRCPTCKGKGEV